MGEAMTKKGSGPPGASDSSDIENDFFPALVHVAMSIGADPEDLMSVMFSESLGVRPDLVNASGHAGIHQLSPGRQQQLGWSGTPAEFGKLSATDQLPFALKYFLP